MKEADLQTIAEGVAQELFDREIKKVAENIGDINTKAQKARKITLEFTFLPDEDRQECKVVVAAKSSLAPTRPFARTVFTGKRNGKETIYVSDQRQTEMFDDGVSVIKKEKSV